MFENTDEDNNNVNEIINIEYQLPPNIFFCLTFCIRRIQIKKGVLL